MQVYKFLAPCRINGDQYVSVHEAQRSEQPQQALGRQKTTQGSCQEGGAHLRPGVGQELELAGGSGGQLGEALQLLLDHVGHRFEGRNARAVVLGPALVVVHVALERVLRVLPLQRLLVVVTLLLRHLVSAFEVKISVCGLKIYCREGAQACFMHIYSVMISRVA